MMDDRKRRTANRGATMAAMMFDAIECNKPLLQAIQLLKAEAKMEDEYQRSRGGTEDPNNSSEIGC